MRRLQKLIEDSFIDRQETYIVTRIDQLEQDMQKAHDEHDRAWYNRVIQELNWVLQMKGKPTHNCYMQKREEHEKQMKEKVGATGGREIWT